ncbi:MAG TPA: SDR family oxidoreductase [Devosia sp.]|nr:SDR family oxidoreductase [Devosia sp.]
MADSFEHARMTGKVAVITGAAQGIGEATARLFAERGARGLVLTDRNGDRLAAVAQSLAGTGAEVETVVAELADMAEVEAIVPAADRRFGRVDILANIAGLTDRSGVRDTTPAMWDRMLAVNVRAPFFLMQAALRVMERERIEGAMVNIASVNAHGGASRLTPYSVSKGALVTLTKNFANAVLYSRIKVNALNLGWIETPGEHLTKTTWDQEPENWAELGARTQPWGRLIQPDEVARAIAWLATAESGVMTGAIVDYGQHVPGAPREAPPAASA